MFHVMLVIGLFSSTLVLADSDRYQGFSAPLLQSGRTLWLENCEGCHGWGIADAPIPMQPDDWRERLHQPRSVLYGHAINGFFGPDDSMMPKRGGNPSLTDHQVQLAVDYMVALAQFHLTQAVNPHKP